AAGAGNRRRGDAGGDLAGVPGDLPCRGRRQPGRCSDGAPLISAVRCRTGGLMTLASVGVLTRGCHYAAVRGCLGWARCSSPPGQEGLGVVDPRPLERSGSTPSPSGDSPCPGGEILQAVTKSS